MNASRRALHIAPIMPADRGNGLAMRQGMFLDSLAREFDVDLVVLPVAGGATEPSALVRNLGIEPKVVPTAGRADTLLSLVARIADPQARLTAFRSYGRSTLAGQLSIPLLAHLREAVGDAQYDLVHIGRSYLADALPAVRAKVATLDFDEDEETAMRELAAGLGEVDAERADWLMAEADAVQRLIGTSAQLVSQHFISSAVDAATLRRQHRTLQPEVVENAVPIPDIKRADDGRTLLFLGSYGYAPNVDAARWLAHEILPLVRQHFPARLLLVGRDADKVAELRGLSGVELVGEVQNVADTYARASLVVAPMRSGAGTRIKLIEAAAHGVPIVATPIAARGLAFVPDQHLLLAEGAAAFAAAIVATLSDPEGAAQRAWSALELTRNRYDREKVVESLACRFREIAKR